MPFIELSIKSDDPFCRKAAYIALAVTAEGCADFIRKKCELGFFITKNSPLVLSKIVIFVMLFV